MPKFGNILKPQKPKSEATESFEAIKNHVRS